MFGKKLPKIGIATIVIKGHKVLLGKRKGSPGKGTWSFPGGKLGFGESPGECCLREVGEETNLDIRLIGEGDLETVTNDIFPDGQHYVTLYLKAEYIGGNPRVMEPEKCEKWGWFTWHELPTPLFLPLQNLVNQTYDPFENNPFASYLHIRRTVS